MRRLAPVVLVLLLVPSAAGFHAAPSAGDEIRFADRDPRVTWRAVAFDPGGDEALVVGGYDPGENRSYSLIARWTPDNGLQEVYNRSGPPLVDVDVREDGTSLVVGLRDTILLGEPGSYRNVWNESRFASQERDLTFYGLGAAFAPHDDFGIVSGSSLLRVDSNGSLEVIHSGQDAFFRTIDFNPVSDYALVEAAIHEEGRTFLGTVWRTNGVSNLSRDDNVAIYGRFQRGNALLNTISFAPNGTFAVMAGRDGSGASFLTWSPDRLQCHRHPNNASRCHDHTYRYMGTSKPTGPVTCISWHPSGRYALATGLEEDVVGYVGAKLWVPLLHHGPQLLGCDFGPDGDRALAVGHNGTLLEIEPGTGPLVRVLDPRPGRLTPPQGEQRFLVGVLERSSSSKLEVTGHVEGNQTPQQAAPRPPWWTLSVNASRLDDGRHHLVVNASSGNQTATQRFPFLVNDDAFSPSTPTILSPRGLEGTNRDSDGLFTLRWQPVNETVVYEIQKRARGSATNTTELIDAGSQPNQTVRVNQDGTYFFRVRAKNAYAVGNWSEQVSVKVVLDSDGDGVPDRRDPQPHTPNQWGDPDGDGIPTDVELKQCSDPYDANSTPTSDDDGDGIPNGIECQQGTDPQDPNDPPPQDEEPTNDSQNDSTNDGGSPDRDTPAPAPIAVLGVVSATAFSLHKRRR